MRQWIIAIFTVHFLLGLMGFAFGPLIQPTAAHPSVVASADERFVPLSGAASDVAVSDLDHALGDELPELPDGMQRLSASATPHGPAPTWTPLRPMAYPRPVVSPPDRPPRAA